MTEEIDGCCPGYRRLSPWRWPRWARIRLGYWIRPYDMLADRRRWRWQPRQRCGLGGLPPEIRAAVIAAVERMGEP